MKTEGALAIIRMADDDDYVEICSIEASGKKRKFQIAYDIDSGVWRDVCNFLGLTQKAAVVGEERSKRLAHG